MRDNKNQSFYVHEVLSIAKGAALFKTGTVNNNGDSGSDAPSVISILQKIAFVNALDKNILSADDKKLLFDEEFYIKYKYESREKIVETADELEMFKNSDDFKELSEDEAFEVDKAARRAGYATPKLYHGTTAFGFTEFDFARSDDNLSVFAI